MIQSNMTFIFNFGNYLFSGWTPSDEQWFRSGLNAATPYPMDFEIEVVAS